MISRLKVLPILLLVATGCSEQVKKDESDTAFASKITSEATTQKIELPSGRWIANNSHCQNEIDIRDTYDFSISENGIKSAGVSTKGIWSGTEKERYLKIVEGVFNGVGKCLDFDESNWNVARLENTSEEIVLAFDVKKEVILRIYNNEKVTVLVPFTVNLVQSYKIIDSLEDNSEGYDPYSDFVNYSVTDEQLDQKLENNESFDEEAKNSPESKLD